MQVISLLHGLCKNGMCSMVSGFYTICYTALPAGNRRSRSRSRYFAAEDMYRIPGPESKSLKHIHCQRHRSIHHLPIIRLAVISPLGLIHISLPELLVASLQVKPVFESSVRRGINAEFDVLGIQSSKKLVSTRGWEGLAIFTSAQTVILLSLPQLSHMHRSMYTTILPHILTF